MPFRFLDPMFPWGGVDGAKPGSAPVLHQTILWGCFGARKRLNSEGILVGGTGIDVRA